MGRRYNRRMANPYESDITRFLRDFKAASPDLERRQRAARATWWDRALDLDEQADFAQARVPQHGYVYQTATRPPERTPK